MRIAVVVGNPKAGSRTLRVAVAVAQRLRGTPPVGPDPLVIDLADHASELFDIESSTIKILLDSVANSDVVVVASPTYKATYTGLVKAFLDRYPQRRIGPDGLHPCHDRRGTDPRPRARGPLATSPG